MNKVLALAMGALLLGGCSLFTPAAPSTPAVTPGEEEAMMEAKVINLIGQSTPDQTGTATFTDLGEGQTKVVIDLSGEPAGAIEPAHIHIGSCPAPGAVKHPLTDVVNGTSETTVMVSMAELFTDEALAVNVHKSAEEIAVYVSCGDLE
jgi:hypothetical protein